MSRKLTSRIAQAPRLKPSLSKLACTAALAASLFVAACQQPGPAATSERARGALPPRSEAPPGAEAGGVGELDSLHLAPNEELWILPRSQGGNYRGPGDSVPPTQGLLDDGDGDMRGIAEFEYEGALGRQEGRPRTPALRPQDIPGTGGMLALAPGAEGLVHVPLRHTAVRAWLSGPIASVDVRQDFENPFDHNIEAVYVFPLPHDAAVSEFVMTIGERRIRGIVRERQEAERLYTEARAQGYTASLMSEQRPNVFTQRVANIGAGKALSTSVRYFHSLPFVDGAYRFDFPMVVGPRFNPPGQAGGIGAAPRRAAATPGTGTRQTYLRPRERSGHDISVEIEIDAGAALRDIECRTHRLAVERPSPSRARLVLDAADSLPNKDLVVRYGVEGERLSAALTTFEDSRGGFFHLTLYPPREPSSEERLPAEMIFVVDSSGSMSGEPMALVKRSLRRILGQLHPGDTFQIMRFSSEVAALFDAPQPVNPRNLKAARSYIEGMRASGGTMMMHGVQASLSARPDPERERIITFMTDGFIGNEEQVLREVKRSIGRARLFSFGIGSSPNRFLLHALAAEGRGRVAFVGLSDSAEEVMDRHIQVLRHPAFRDVRIDWDALGATDVYPARIPDLFHGRPVNLVGRFTGEVGGEPVIVSGMVGSYARHLSLQSSASPFEHSALPQIWARARIAELRSQARAAHGGAERESFAQAIMKTALDYGLSSPYTAFIAVDSSERIQGQGGTTVEVPVPVPEGVDYETTVEGGAARR